MSAKLQFALPQVSSAAADPSNEDRAKRPRVGLKESGGTAAFVWSRGCEYVGWPRRFPEGFRVSGFPRSRIRLWARAPEAESCDLDENTVLDLDASGGICGITVEHAKVRADLPQCSFEQVGV